MFKTLKTKKGFTLIELLVVVAIISLLSSIVFASLNGARSKARDARRVSDIHQLQIALELYYEDNAQTYPSDPGYCFNNGNSVIAGATKALAPYLSTISDDPSSGATYCYVGGTASGSQQYGIKYCRENKSPDCCYVRTDNGLASGWWGVSTCPN